MCAVAEVTPLVLEWIEEARACADADERDRLVYAEAIDRRVSPPRRVVVGGVVDGRKPGVLLAHLTEDRCWAECGVSTIEHARAVIEALCLAWPELRGEARA
jgi:hypothetical protein